MIRGWIAFVEVDRVAPSLSSPWLVVFGVPCVCYRSVVLNTTGGRLFYVNVCDVFDLLYVNHFWRIFVYVLAFH